jgi:hypothetical protein
MVVLSAATPAVLAQDAGPLTVLNGADVPPWRTISLGTFTSSYGLMTALDDADIAIGDLADEAMHGPAFTVAKSKSEVDLVVLSAAQLGVGETGTSRQDILARARRLDLDLCPLEAAAQLRLQYLDQPVGEFLDVAMEPITTYGGYTVAFTLANGGAGLMIIGYIVTEDVIISQERKFVFARPLRVAQPVVR